MGRPKPCNCSCEQVDPNCLGCASPAALPLTWVMDFASPMSYLYPRTGSVTIAEYNATGYPQAASGGTIQKKRYFSTTWDFPEIELLGTSTSLVIDDAPIASPYYGSSTECIWANETFTQYRVLRGTYTYSTFFPGSGAPMWHDAVCATGTDYGNSSPWYYYSEVGSSYIPPGFSLNRVRNSIGAADALCSTSVYPGGHYKLTYDCGVRMYGCFAILTVVNTGVSYDLYVTIYWWPRVAWSSYEKFYFLSTGGTYFWNQTPLNYGLCDTTHDARAAIYVLDGNDTKTVVYPDATNGVSQGPILQYKKSFVCATEFDGSPVSLPLFHTVTFPGAAETIVEAIGITNVPSSITITPVI